MVSPDIVKWLTVQIADLTSRGSITRFELYHTVEESPAERIQVFGLEEEEGADPEELGQTIWDMAENDAASRSMGTIERYVIWAFRGESDEMDSQYAFTIRGKTMTHAYDGESSEPATERGHTGQMMRHNESIHRMMMLMTDATAGRLASELQQERKRREEVENKMLETMKLHQDLLDRKADRDLRDAKEQAKARRHDELMGFFLSMAPLLVSQFMGHKGMGGTGSAAMRDAAIGKILKNLSQEEAMTVLQSLKGSNQLAFMELYKSYAQEDAQEQADKPIPFRDPKASGSK
jgi:hypothetical protein